MGLEADRDIATPAPGGPIFWTAVVVGWGLIAFGIIGAVGEARDTHPRSLAIWILGSLALHDLLIAPAALLAGGAVRRVVGGRARAAVQAALILSATLVAVSVPVIGRFGARPDNPSLMPRNAGIGLLVALGFVWAYTAVVLFAGWRRR